MLIIDFLKLEKMAISDALLLKITTSRQSFSALITIEAHNATAYQISAKPNNPRQIFVFYREEIELRKGWAKCLSQFLKLGPNLWFSFGGGRCADWDIGTAVS